MILKRYLLIIIHLNIIIEYNMQYTKYYIFINNSGSTHSTR